MTASDVRTSVNSVGAVAGNEVDDNSQARCPAPVWAPGLGNRCLRGEVRVRLWPRQAASVSCPRLQTACQGLGPGRGRGGLDSDGPGSRRRTCPLWGTGHRYDFQEGNVAMLTKVLECAPRAHNSTLRMSWRKQVRGAIRIFFSSSVLLLAVDIGKLTPTIGS